MDKDFLRQLKKRGFSDSRIASLCSTDEAEVYKKRIKVNLKPVFKRVDTCAAEFDTSTAYLYSTYDWNFYNEIFFCNIINLFS